MRSGDAHTVPKHFTGRTYAGEAAEVDALATAVNPLDVFQL
jgi:hypothetical protein